MNADLLIAIGMRFDDRATGRVDGFAPKARIIHIDIDPAEIGKNVRVDVPIVGDVKKCCKSLNKQINAATEHIDWLQQLDSGVKNILLPHIRDCAESSYRNMLCVRLYDVTRGRCHYYYRSRSEPDVGGTALLV